MKVVVTTTDFASQDPEPLDLLKKYSNEVILNPYRRMPTEEELYKLLVDADGLIAGVERLSKAVLQSTSALKVISRVGTGLDSIDISYAKERGIKVLRTPEAPAPAVAELALGMTLAALRKISFLDRNIRHGKWVEQMGSLLENKTYGILGLGFVGKRLVELLSPFRCNLLAYDIIQDTDFAKKHQLAYRSLDEVLQQSDVVSVHLPLLPDTLGILNASKFSLMKPGAILINTARGKILVEDDLVRALKEGPIGFACLDVFEKEPYSGPLAYLDNTLLTSHIASYTRETRIRMEKEATSNLLKGLGLLS